MENNQLAKQEKNPLKSFFERDVVKSKFAEMLGERSSSFISSVVQIASQNQMLKNCEPLTLYNTAVTAAALNLPLNKDLGFAWVVPYKNKDKVEAQFQLGYKGIIQLAIRSGQYLKINTTPVYENQYKSWNALTEDLQGDFGVDGKGEVVGYVAYFKLVNGFEKTAYWSKEKVLEHAKRFSKTFTSGPWKSDFDAMAQKTVLKNTLGRYGAMSIEMEKAIKVDQSVIKNEDASEVEYVDHEEVQEEPVDVVSQRLITLIQECATLKDLEAYDADIKDASAEVKEAYMEKYAELTGS